ncbi:DUF4992 family lipoprotein [Bacteroides sp. 224]|uniref:DUF4992 family lipoprotein n=1 Tax=Bacteroides sp. 224 TaxID=2302936 RepID=UPI0013D28328|nr:DUF4992 family lipoprotein [Bacteroides sp. 224]NDV64065.1 DUF4957 domain-containing protein [Bacteroides sp. 224]
MKKNLFLLGKTGGWIVAIALFLFSSCAQGYDEDWTFESDVRDAQLESPEEIAFAANPEGTEVIISWPVVRGAGGYELSFYIADDPNNLVPVGKEKEIVDGCSIKREILEDTKYVAVVKALGNEKNNNREALEETKREWSTLVEATIIPSGTDLGTYFAENSFEDGAAFELEGGAEYTLSKNVNLAAKSIIIRGSRLNHAKIKVTSNAMFVSNGAGLKLKFLDFDLSGTTKEFINYGDPATELPTQGNDKYVANSPVLIEECHFSGMTYRLLNSSSSKKYFVSVLTINNSVFDMSLSSSFIQFSGSAYIKDFTIKNSTLNNKKGASTSQRLVQYGNGSIAKSGVTSSKLLFTNSTFYNISSAQKIANYNMMRQSSYTVELRKNIFVDCGNKRLVKDLVADNTNPKLICEKNAYWYDGAFPTEETTDSKGDKSGTHFSVDPAFVNSAQNNFKVTASELISNKIGDPRWLE